TRSKRDWSSDVCSSDLVACDVSHFLNVFLFRAQFCEVTGHSDGFQEPAQTFDTLFCRFLRIFEVHLAAPHADCGLSETHYIMFQVVGKHCRHHYSQTGAVSTVILSGKFMFNVMARPVLRPAYAAGVIMRHHTGPHDIGSCLVVMRIRDHSWALDRKSVV